MKFVFQLRKLQRRRRISGGINGGFAFTRDPGKENGSVPCMNSAEESSSAFVRPVCVA